MDSFISDYAERFRYLSDETHSVIDRFPDEALDWTATENMNSAAVLVTHLVGAARYWIGDVACGDQSTRVRANEFKVKNTSSAQLKEVLDAGVTFIEQKLSTLSVEDFSAERYSDRFGRTFTLGWCLLHTLEHTAVHVGHLHQLLELYEHRNEK